MLDMQFYKPFTRVEGGGLRAKAGISLLFIIHLGTCVGHWALSMYLWFLDK
jgi:hypothetical protein